MSWMPSCFREIRERPMLLSRSVPFSALRKLPAGRVLTPIRISWPKRSRIISIWIGKELQGDKRVDSGDIKQLEPKLELIKEYKPSEMVAFSRFPAWWRAFYRVQELNSTLRRLQRTLVYRF